MNPVVIGECQLWLGDCRDILPSLPKVDAVVTDPPYGIRFKYASHDDTGEGYGQWIWRCISAAEALCTAGAPIFVWQAQENVRQFSEWFPRDWRIFIAAKNFTQMRKTVMQFAYEPVLVWWTPGDKSDNGKEVGTINRDWFISDTASAVSHVEALQKGHPCPRQVDVCTFIVGNWTKRQANVLDPFMGSGTTGVACVNLGRKFIGIEIEERYFQIACRRIEDAVKQGRLSFVERPKAEQLSMV